MTKHTALVRAGFGIRVGLAAAAALSGLQSAAWARAVALEEVLDAAREAKAEGVPVLVVMDLDETVVDSTPRTWATLRQASRTLCEAGELARQTCETVSSLNLSEIYGLPNTYDSAALARWLGLDPLGPDWVRLSRAALEEYLSGRHEQRWDQPVAGANAYVRELQALGVKTYFVSSRFDDVQRASTLASLSEMGMLGERDAASVVLRPRGMSSIDFKRWAFGGITADAKARGARVIGAFENEPENMQAMKAAFPGARLVFVEGSWLKEAAVPLEAARIMDYR